MEFGSGAYLPAEQQVAVFDAIRDSEFIRPTHKCLYLPEIVLTSQIATQGFDVWLAAQHERIAAEKQANADWEGMGEYPRVFDSVSVYADGNRTDMTLNPFVEWAAQLDAWGQISNSDFLIFPNDTVRQPNFYLQSQNADLYDVMGARLDEVIIEVDGEWVDRNDPPMLIDINTALLDSIDSERDLRELTWSAAFGVHSRHTEFVAQASSLNGGAGKNGLDLYMGLPYYAKAHHIAKAVLGTDAFQMPITLGYDGEAELAPLLAYEVPPRPEDVDISGITGLLEYEGTEQHRLQIFGKGIVRGEPFVISDPNSLDLAPEGSIVMIDDEYGMHKIPAEVFADASAILTRGLTGERGIRAHGNHEHISIIGRGLAAQNDRFVHFKLPHMNPDSRERGHWDMLKRCRTVTVASDGTSVKIVPGL